MDKPNIKAIATACKTKIFADKKLFIIILVGVLGMLILLFSELGESEAHVQPIVEKDIEMQMTEELTDILEKISGAGRVKVMLTFESSQESVFASDTDENVDSEIDGGEERKTKSEHIIIKSDNGEEGLKVKDIYPKIRGVAVVCDGGSNSVVKGQIISMISALFNINSTKISVAAMAD
ncbi:MAG: hypothetical protein NC122_03230 [Faecalibacterium sp.]|nr:hypothetical protein [Ruminococcus sp.]MCM1392729.1 hypothetical protein [Ruminococcus sp.]MCM1485199.1 hypothetical protein [Faecalibacterium sp.]